MSLRSTCSDVAKIFMSLHPACSDGIDGIEISLPWHEIRKERMDVATLANLDVATFANLDEATFANLDVATFANM